MIKLQNMKEKSCLNCARAVPVKKDGMEIRECIVYSRAVVSWSRACSNWKPEKEE